MSHLCEIQQQYRDVEALRAALKELGLELGGPGNVQYYFSGRTEYQTDADKQLEQADHVVHIPGSRYSLGFKRQEDGSFKPICDSELLDGDYGANDPGRKILGEKAIRLWQAYAFAGAAMQARRKGYSVTRQNLKDGSMKIRVKVR